MPLKKLDFGLTGDAFACNVFGVALTTGDSIVVCREDRASACTVGAETVATTAASANEEAPARKHIRNEVFDVMLRDFLRITIPGFY